MLNSRPPSVVCFLSVPASTNVVSTPFNIKILLKTKKNKNKKSDDFCQMNFENSQQNVQTSSLPRPCHREESETEETAVLRPPLFDSLKTTVPANAAPLPPPSLLPTPPAPDVSHPAAIAARKALATAMKARYDALLNTVESDFDDADGKEGKSPPPPPPPVSSFQLTRHNKGGNSDRHNDSFIFRNIIRPIEKLLLGIADSDGDEVGSDDDNDDGDNSSDVDDVDEGEEEEGRKAIATQLTTPAPATASAASAVDEEVNHSRAIPPKRVRIEHFLSTCREVKRSQNKQDRGGRYDGKKEGALKRGDDADNASDEEGGFIVHAADILTQRFGLGLVGEVCPPRPPPPPPSSSPSKVAEEGKQQQKQHQQQQQEKGSGEAEKKAEDDHHHQHLDDADMMLAMNVNRRRRDHALKHNLCGRFRLRLLFQNKALGGEGEGETDGSGGSSTSSLSSSTAPSPSPSFTLFPPSFLWVLVLATVLIAAVLGSASSSSSVHMEGPTRKSDG